MMLDEGGWRRASVRVVAPPASLCDVVELFWIDEWERGESSARMFRVVADDAPHVIWHLSGSRLPRTERVSFVGARARHHDVDLSGRSMSIGARLRPGAVPVVVGLPAFTLTNRSVPLERFVGPALARGIHQMRPSSPDAAVHLLCELIDHLRHSARLDPRATWLARHDRGKTPSVEAFARETGMRPRTVRAWSAETLGMGLKQLFKIRRLHAALELWMSGTHQTWSQVAAATGYADQSHLIRDCRALLGESPAAFVKRAG